MPSGTAIAGLLGEVEWNRTRIKSYVYIDDFNAIEKLNVKNAISHITTNIRVIKPHAEQSEKLFSGVSQLATKINMRVNSSKTQMLCLHPYNHEEVTSYIRTEGANIMSGKSLKILGFNFDRNPSATYHVGLLVNKFYSRLWTLRFLKKSGMSVKYLLVAYKTIILPSVEYASVVYHSLIPNYMSERLESVHRHALRIIHGWDTSITRLIQNGDMETLQTRRENSVKKFALKSELNPRFSERWFVPRARVGLGLRDSTRNKYEEPRYRNERLKNNPVCYMTRILNKEHKANGSGH